MSIKKQTLVLIGSIGVLIIFHFWGYIGHYGYDDLQYAELAKGFMEGNIDYNDHFSFRTPVIVLTSLCYLFFGISDFSSSLPAIFISIGILWVVFNVLKNKGTRTLIFGMALLLLSKWLLFYSDKLMPDIYVAFSVIISLYLIDRYRSHHKNNSTFLFSFLLSISLLFGFMSKGTILLILPLLIYYLIIDIINNRNVKFWKYTIVTGVVIFAIYFLIIWLLTGDFLKRFESIASNSYLNLCSYNQQSTKILVKRITFGFFEMIISQGMGTGFVFIMAYLAEKKSLKIFRMDDSFSFWVSSSLILLLSSNFMSISLTSYSPMCLDPRHYLFLVPVVSIPSAMIINDFVKTKNLKWGILIFSGLVAIASIFLREHSFERLYFPLFLLLLAYTLIKNNKIARIIFSTLLLGTLLIQPLYMVKYARGVKYHQQKEIFLTQVLNTNDSCMVITNNVQKRLGRYYNHFGEDGKIAIVNYDEFEYDSTDSRKKILFLNGHTRFLSGMSNEDLPFYAKNISAQNKLLYQNKDINIAVYEMKEFVNPQLTGKLLLESKNGFENKINHWKVNSENITHEIKYEGDVSVRFVEFSPTFEYALDSLGLNNLSDLFIECSAYCYYDDKTNAKFVVSIENEEGSYFWKGIAINKYIKAYSNWWSVKCEVSIKKNVLKKHSKIKIYLWNEDKQQSYIDDFQIRIFSLDAE